MPDQCIGRVTQIANEVEELPISLDALIKRREQHAPAPQLVLRFLHRIVSFAIILFDLRCVAIADPSTAA